MTPLPFSRFLVRMPRGSAAALQATGAQLAAAGVSLEIDPTPILQSAPEGRTRGVNAAGGWEWHVAHAPQSMAGAHAWELAHGMATRGFGAAGAPDVVIEPD